MPRLARRPRMTMRRVECMRPPAVAAPARGILRIRHRCLHTEPAYRVGTVARADPSLPLRNFGPGPAPMPAPVLQQIQEELLDWRGTGISVLSMSHRSPEFGDILAESSGALREALELPGEFELIFAQGGGHGQFAAVPLNLCAGEAAAHYLVTGSWSARAAAEAENHLGNVTVERLEPGTSCAAAEPDVPEGAAYVYVCSNETVNGVAWHGLPDVPDHVPLVVDMSSDFGARQVEWGKVGVAFACTPKNLGHAGLTVVAVRKDLLAGREPRPSCPGALNWRLAAESDSTWQTPPTFNIYTSGLVAAFITREGGVPEMASRCEAKAKRLYDLIDDSGGFYISPVADKACRSHVNVPFRLRVADSENFLRAAWRSNIVGLYTETPFSGGGGGGGGGGSEELMFRASVYNHVTEEDVEVLAAFMEKFMLSSSTS
eukprot:SAG22_NODE_445_length_10447_cov_4.063104_9_plen_432_part_00